MDCSSRTSNSFAANSFGRSSQPIWLPGHSMSVVQSVAASASAHRRGRLPWLVRPPAATMRVAAPLRAALSSRKSLTPSASFVKKKFILASICGLGRGNTTSGSRSARSTAANAVNACNAALLPSRRNVSTMSSKDRIARSRSASGKSSQTGGSCATSTRTCSGCRATSSRPIRAPMLLPKTNEGSLVSAASKWCTSSLWVATVGVSPETLTVPAR